MPLVLGRCLRQLFLRPTITTNVSNTCTKLIVLIALTKFRPPPPGDRDAAARDPRCAGVGVRDCH
ncbi:hypothetical protein FIBSPDRAFT_875586 [Athelia psychrophila]|uniref:Uncharacterized protein n=1 Tax=Athelia psychrophila TaxID=1759441 RepID=A0A167XL62_9AGAM|nr:hypothetical protein FIBSPDRAFT_875586 [Fibularhizoctonia sp. CBS 109695]